MHVTMVKKRFADGSTCAKCAAAEEVLRRRGVWEGVDEIVWADETDAGSPGMVLARELGVELAPFFVVRRDDGSQAVFVSTIQLIKRVLKRPVAPPLPTPGGSVDLAEAERALVDLEPVEAVRWTLDRYGPATAIAFSGAEDVALIDMAAASGLPFSVFSLDTGRLHPETYAFLDEVRAHYGVPIEIMSPDAAALQSFVRGKGLFSFYEDGHQECCGVRKVEPLRRALGGRTAWITGQRRDQSPTRADVPVVQLDPAFGSAEAPLVKVNPLAEWSSEQVWAYLRERGVPFNKLHLRGFVSIGCEPCTRPVHPGQHEREGRWWWEEATRRECGLHVAPSAEDEDGEVGDAAATAG